MASVRLSLFAVGLLALVGASSANSQSEGVIISGSLPCTPQHPEYCDSPEARRRAEEQARAEAERKRREDYAVSQTMRAMGLPPGREEEARELVRKRVAAGFPPPDPPKEAPICTVKHFPSEGSSPEAQGETQAKAEATARVLYQHLSCQGAPVNRTGRIDRVDCRSVSPLQLGGAAASHAAVFSDRPWWLCSLHYVCDPKGDSYKVCGPAKGSSQ